MWVGEIPWTLTICNIAARVLSIVDFLVQPAKFVYAELNAFEPRLAQSASQAFMLFIVK